jgi:type I restriction enzyme S subunit
MELREARAGYLVETEQRVPKGYKQTEVGVIPEDWDVKQIEDLQPFVTSGSRGWATFYSNHGAPFIRITNLIRGSIYLDLNDLRFVSLPTDNSEGARTQLKEGDVLISITADIGIVGYISANVPRPAYINQHIALVRFNTSETDPKFVCYFLASEQPQKLFRALTDSGAKAGMNLTTVKQIRLALPPTKAEQETIAEALSDADELIEALEQLITKKRYIKQGAMQELLRPKEAWLKKRLGSLAAIINGRAYSLTEWEERGTPVIRLQNLTGRGEIYYYSNLNLPEKQYCQSGDLLFMWSATFGPIIWQGPKAIFHYHIWKIECQSSQLNKEYLYHLLSDITENLKCNSSSGGTMLHLTKSGMESMEISVPDYDTQEAIATILSDMDAEIAALEEKLAKTRSIKQGMMHNLLTGRIRLL